MSNGRIGWQLLSMWNALDSDIHVLLAKHHSKPCGKARLVDETSDIWLVCEGEKLKSSGLELWCGDGLATNWDLGPKETSAK